jgi:sugar lactone lactonase YvrE
MPAAAAKRRRGEPQDLKPKTAADARSGLRLAITVLAVSVCMLERAGAEPGTLTVTTLAGEYRSTNSFANSADGSGASAVMIGSPMGLDMWWPSGDSVLFLSHKSELRRLQVATEEVSTLTKAPFQWDAGDLAASKLRVAPTGEAAYIVNKYSIYKVDLTGSSYEVPSTPWVGSNSEPPSDASDTMHARYYSSQADAVGTNAGFHTILWTDFAPDGASLIVLDGFPEVDDAYRVKIRRVNCNTAQVSTIGFVHHDDADGNLLKAPQSLAVSPDGQSVFITEFGKHRIVKADISTNKNYDELNDGDAIMCSCTCGEANCYACGNAHCMWCGSHPQKDFFEFPSACAITATIVAGSVSGTAGFANGVGTHASFKGPRSLDLSPDGATLLITEAQGDGSLGGTIRALEISSATVSTVAGSPGDLCDHCDTCTARSCDGDVVKASFNVFSGAVYGTSKTQIYVGDYQVIRQIAPPAANSSTTAARTTGIVTTAWLTDTSTTSVIASSSPTTVFSSSLSTGTPSTTLSTIAGAGAETTMAEGRMGSTSAPGTGGGSTPAASSSSTPAPTTWSSTPYSYGGISSMAGAGAETTTVEGRMGSTSASGTGGGSTPAASSSSTPAPTTWSSTPCSFGSSSSTAGAGAETTTVQATTMSSSTVVISRAFFLFFPCNHSVNINIIIFFFRRSKRQRNFSLFYFASQES